jgi:DNA-binding response OmpR family regulator
MKQEFKVIGKKVLVVEDDADTTQLFKMALERDGHEVRAARNASEAIAVALSFKPGIVVIDIGLPDMNGHRLVPVLRAQAELADCRFIAVTGHTAQSMVARSIAAGFQAHLTKPVSAASLLDAIRA